jgi:YVTN family beta-propeller protein
MSYSLGVDLGTTFVAAAIARLDRVEMFTLGDRTVVAPAVVYAREDGSIVTGEAANRRAVSTPERVGRDFKRHLGDPTPVMLGGAPYAVTSLLRALLSEAVDGVTASEGAAPDRVVLTHPANWGRVRRELFEEVPRLADVPRARMVTEPEAAAAHYAAARQLADGDTVAVYDLGGGTFDVTVLRKHAAGVEILGTPEGIERLGGIDFDDAVMSYINYSSGGALSELDMSNPQTAVAVARLRQDCILAKEALSIDTEATIPVFLPDRHFDVLLSRVDFEDMIRAQVESTVGALCGTLRSAQVEPAELTAVLLVGGSSRIPLVAQMITEALDRPTLIDAHPKYAVALGAARLGADLTLDAAEGSRTGGIGPPGGDRSQGVGAAALGALAAAGAVGPGRAAPTGGGGPGGGLATAMRAAGAPVRLDPSPRDTDPADAASDDTDAAHPPPPSEFGPPAGPAVTGWLTDAQPEPGPGVPGYPERSHNGPEPPPPPRRTDPHSLRGAAIATAGAAALLVLIGSLVFVVARSQGHEAQVLPDSDVGSSAVMLPPPAQRPVSSTPPVATSLPIPAVAGEIPVGKTPGFVAIAPSGEFAYIANRAAGVVTVVDTAIDKVVATIPVPDGPPQYLAFAPDGKRLYVSVFNDPDRSINEVAVLDSRTNTVLTKIKVGTRPFALNVTPDGSQIYVPNHDSGTVSVIDTATNSLVADIPVKPNPHWVAFSADGTRAYTANHDSNLVSVIDTASRKVVDEVPVQTSPHSVAVDPTQPLVANVNYDSNSVTVIDTKSDKVVATVPVGTHPQDVAWAPDGRHLYVTNVDSDDMTVIAADGYRGTATIPTGDAPTSVAVLPDGTKAYVSNLNSGSLTVLNLSG